MVFSRTATRARRRSGGISAAASGRGPSGCWTSTAPGSLRLPALGAHVVEARAVRSPPGGHAPDPEAVVAAVVAEARQRHRAHAGAGGVWKLSGRFARLCVVPASREPPDELLSRTCPANPSAARKGPPSRGTSSCTRWRLAALASAVPWSLRRTFLSVGEVRVEGITISTRRRSSTLRHPAGEAC